MALHDSPTTSNKIQVFEISMNLLTFFSNGLLVYALIKRRKKLSRPQKVIAFVALNAFFTCSRLLVLRPLLYERWLRMYTSPYQLYFGLSEDPVLEDVFGDRV